MGYVVKQQSYFAALHSWFKGSLQQQTEIYFYLTVRSPSVLCFIVEFYQAHEIVNTYHRQHHLHGLHSSLLCGLRLQALAIPKIALSLTTIGKNSVNFPNECWDQRHKGFWSAPTYPFKGRNSNEITRNVSIEEITIWNASGLKIFKRNLYHALNHKLSALCTELKLHDRKRHTIIRPKLFLKTSIHLRLWILSMIERYMNQG